jgi:hypothetical protein
VHATDDAAVQPDTHRSWRFRSALQGTRETPFEGDRAVRLGSLKVPASSFHLRLQRQTGRGLANTVRFVVISPSCERTPATRSSVGVNHYPFRSSLSQIYYHRQRSCVRPSIPFRLNPYDDQQQSKPTSATLISNTRPTLLFLCRIPLQFHSSVKRCLTLFNRPPSSLPTRLSSFTRSLPTPWPLSGFTKAPVYQHITVVFPLRRVRTSHLAFSTRRPSTPSTSTSGVSLRRHQPWQVR